MPELRINGLPAKVDEGATVLDAAELVFVDIPTLCHMKGCEPETSCMLCVVKNVATGQLIPACSAKAVDGMEIDTECAEVQSARRDILNLLLSEHVGDCEAPCTRICPAHLDIPLMLRAIEHGNLESAAWIAKRDLAIPATLGHVCPAPCEKGCRRAQVDEAITIRDLHREVTEGSTEGSVLCFNVFSEKHHFIGLTPKSMTPKSKSVAVIGSGPAGLSCAWKLIQLGYGCTVFDEAPKAGGVLREHNSLPMDVLDDEVDWLAQAGVEFSLGAPISMHEAADGFDGIVFAETEFSGTHFADAFYAEEHKLAVKAVANGKAAAVAVDRFLKGEPPSNKEPFDSKTGKLRESEVQELTKNCATVEQAGMPAPQAEAARCLHCDCRKAVSCKLRKYATQYGANQREFPADERGHVQLIGHDEAVVFEPGKCIKCGLCVKITKRAGEELGVTFVGRGYNTRVAVPFEEALQDGLREAATECVEACPTGALAFRNVEER
ncbi:2Fe-2S iron-sulfur cluster-binding protein [Pontiella sulfatireligans]|uniref:NADPH-Fe(3+) oxidoreductase subunit beta n=1 Tax=Pontiella sulfatireligans TaxID=2750658 RepID=A0A6C2UR72_9BACT|nr:2Fe-2S iron-sulfur cluster-binding protein [Pontiella sulfatireligans]VGO21747.1 NADPH-Fe(3+) oxidoreductase subunit beta [Pontiella sulfatireligans]